MKQLLRIFVIIVLPLGIITSCISNHKETKVIERNPNVILLIGDGMGLSELSASFYYGQAPSNFTRFNEVGLINTSSKKQKITDSSAAATAFACGERTYNGGLGVAGDSTIIENLVEILSIRGYNTGVIATSSVTHATPAGFYAHVVNRGMEEDIALQLIDSDIDFFAGGGLKYFSNRSDSIDIFPQLESKGFTMNTEIENLTPNENNKYGFLLADGGMPRMLDNRGDFLPDYTKFALDYFSQSEDNFFLMVEGSQIDWAGHGNDADYLISEMLDFDKTVGVAMDYAELKGNTLVIVLADHETGGFALAPDSGDYSKIKPAFATTGHSTTLIPVFAYGPGAENFKGIYDNNEIFHKILDLVNR